MFGFFASTFVAFVKDIEYGKKKINFDDREELRNRDHAFIRGTIGIVIEILMLIYFAVLMLS